MSLCLSTNVVTSVPLSQLTLLFVLHIRSVASDGGLKRNGAEEEIMVNLCRAKPN